MYRVLQLIALVVVASASAVAQLPLSERSLPSEPLRYIQSVTQSDLVAFDSGGRNRVWNYSSLQEGRERLVTHLTPAALSPSVIAQFPLTQVAVQSDTVLTLYARVGQFFRQLGTITPSTQTAVVIDPYDTRPTEIVYSGRIIDAHRADLRVTTTPPYTGSRRGQSTTSYDAAGTLILPSFVFTNVARLSTMMITVDTLRGGSQTLIVRTETRRMTFQEVNSPIILLDHSNVIRTVSRGGSPVGQPDTVVTTAFLARDPVTSVGDAQSQAHPSVTPSPATSNYLRVHGLQTTPISIVLVSINGMQTPVTDWTGASAETINVSLPSVANGVYTLRMQMIHGNVVTVPLVILR